MHLLWGCVADLKKIPLPISLLHMLLNYQESIDSAESETHCNKEWMNKQTICVLHVWVFFK